jgi:hypothetical protein
MNYIAEIKKHWENHKQKVCIFIAVLVLMAATSAGVHAMFRVDGVVTGVDNSSITVTDFFRTQTIDLVGSPFNTATIKLGERIRIQKNLQGNVLYLTTSDLPHGERHEESRGKDKPRR